jgi:hypothetical protein
MTMHGARTRIFLILSEVEGRRMTLQYCKTSTRPSTALLSDIFCFNDRGGGVRMAMRPLLLFVVPAKAGTQGNSAMAPWIPASAGMTKRESGA